MRVLTAIGNVVGSVLGVLLLGALATAEHFEKRTYAQRHETDITGPLS